MHKKHKAIAWSISLTVGWISSFGLNLNASESAGVTYTLGSITVLSTGAIDPLGARPYPYLRFLKWLTPTTHPSIIYREIQLDAGATFDAQALLAIKQRLMALPYFSMVSYKVVDAGSRTTDLIVETKDRWPITLDVSLDQGPLFTITHHNVWGYGHGLSQQLFLKKRWGYGLVYELPKLNCFFGSAYYNQIGDLYKFNHWDIWVSKLWAIFPKQSACYWISGLSFSQKEFVTSIATRQNRSYQDYALVLGKVGWVADGYATIKSVYTLHDLETLPKGGSIEVLYGYQNGAFQDRHYMGINAIKNIATSTLRYLHVNCESGAFIYKKVMEEAILKLALAYAGPPIQVYYGMRQFIDINYILGYRMPKERMLGLTARDPDLLEPPERDNQLHAPIYGRLNVHLATTLHKPILLDSVGFVCLAYTKLIVLYNQDHQPLNQTWIDEYGLGFELENNSMPWPTLKCTIGYSPLLGKVVPSVQVAMQFKNKTHPKPTLVSYA